MIKTIFLDIDNTLLDFQAGAELAMKLALEEHRLPHSDGLFSTFLRVNDALWLEIEQGTLTKEQLHRLRWNKIFAEQGIAFDGILFEQSFLKYLAQTAIPIEGAASLLQYLSGRYMICAVTNGAPLQQKKRLETVGMLSFFDRLFASEEIGFAKPSSCFFDACFSALPDALPSETMIIGDSITADMLGGMRYGLQTCWFNYHHLSPPTELSFTYAVNALGEIKLFL